MLIFIQSVSQVITSVIKYGTLPPLRSTTRSKTPKPLTTADYLETSGLPDILIFNLFYIILIRNGAFGNQLNEIFLTSLQLKLHYPAVSFTDSRLSGLPIAINITENWWRSWKITFLKVFEFTFYTDFTMNFFFFNKYMILCRFIIMRNTYQLFLIHSIIRIFDYPNV